MTIRWSLSIKLAVFVAGALMSVRWMESPWVVGPVFGVVVAVWQMRTFRDVLTPRAFAFLLASTLLYALMLRWFDPALFSDRPDNLWLVVLAGTALLPLAHAVCFGTSWRRTLLAIPGIYASWLLVGWLIQHSPLAESPLGRCEAAVVWWQLLYLMFVVRHAHR